jgi:porphobilinogen deaminase
VDGDTLTMDACVCSLDGTSILRTTHSGAADQAEAIGKEAAANLLAQGADSIIAGIV